MQLGSTSGILGGRERAIQKREHWTPKTIKQYLLYQLQPTFGISGAGGATSWGSDSQNQNHFHWLGLYLENVLSRSSVGWVLLVSVFGNMGAGGIILEFDNCGTACWNTICRMSNADGVWSRGIFGSWDISSSKALQSYYYYC
jgi:hypothetical protein